MFHLAPIAAGAFSADVPISNVFKACQANVALVSAVSTAECHEHSRAVGCQVLQQENSEH